MNYETIITIGCILAAIITITISFRIAHWRNRAERAEAALARVEAVIADEATLVVVANNPLAVGVIS